MTWKPAAIRAIRSFLQACAAALIAFTTWLGSQSALDWVELGKQAEKLFLALGLAATYALVSFIHNFLELNFGSDKFRG